MNVMQNMDNLMKPIPSEIKILYDALLVKRGVPLWTDPHKLPRSETMVSNLDGLLLKSKFDEN